MPENTLPLLENEHVEPALTILDSVKEGKKLANDYIFAYSKMHSLGKLLVLVCDNYSFENIIFLMQLMRSKSLFLLSKAINYINNLVSLNSGTI